jgi:hypothetical protein
MSFDIFDYFGAGFILAGTIWTSVSIGIYRSAIRTRATIIQLVSQNSEPGSSPVFCFRDQSGTTHTITSRWSNFPAIYFQGQQVDVLYRLEAPEKARVYNPVVFYLLPAILIGLGAYCIFGFGVTSLNQENSRDEKRVKRAAEVSYAQRPHLSVSDA